MKKRSETEIIDETMDLLFMDSTPDRTDVIKQVILEVLGLGITVVIAKLILTLII